MRGASAIIRPAFISPDTAQTIFFPWVLGWFASHKLTFSIFQEVPGLRLLEIANVGFRSVFLFCFAEFACIS